MGGLIFEPSYLLLGVLWYNNYTLGIYSMYALDKLSNIW